MVETLYIPAVTEQLTQLTTAIAQMKAAGIKAGMKATADRANQIGTLLDLLPHPGAGTPPRRGQSRDKRSSRRAWTI